MMCEMERPRPKPRNRQPKNKTTGEENSVKTDFPGLERLKSALHDDVPDNPAARRCLASQVKEFEQGNSRIRYKQAVTNDGQVFNIPVTTDSESEMEESPVKLRGVRVMFPDNHAARRRLASQYTELERCRSMKKSPVKLPGVKVFLPRKKC